MTPPNISGVKSRSVMNNQPEQNAGQIRAQVGSSSCPNRKVKCLVLAKADAEHPFPERRFSPESRPNMNALCYGASQADCWIWIYRDRVLGDS